jgi:hypothetical protein
MTPKERPPASDQEAKRAQTNTRSKPDNNQNCCGNPGRERTITPREIAGALAVGAIIRVGPSPSPEVYTLERVLADPGFLSMVRKARHAPADRLPKLISIFLYVTHWMLHIAKRYGTLPLEDIPLPIFKGADTPTVEATLLRDGTREIIVLPGLASLPPPVMIMTCQMCRQIN